LYLRKCNWLRRLWPSKSISVTRKKPKPAESALRSYALAFPEAYEEFPWGHRAIKVRGKVFVFMADDADGFSLSVKLPSSGMVALDLPFASPTGYGLGQSGWVSAQFAPSVRIPVPLLRDWIEESYRAIAPKKLLGQLDVTDGSPTTGRASAARRVLSRRRTRRS
jgi:predicted DNA-binding protein (MmcQ/YjbR family)